MVAVAVDSNFVDFENDIRKEILAKELLRTEISDSGESKTLNEAFQTVHNSFTATGDAWMFIADISSGGILTKGLQQPSFAKADFNIGDIKNKTTHSKSVVDFPAKLIAIQETFDLTNEQMAQVMNSSRKSVHNWMTGTSRPNKTKAKRILELFNISKMWIDRSFSVDRDLLGWIDESKQQSLLSLLCQPNISKADIMFHGSSMLVSDLMDFEELEDPFV